MKNNNKRIRTAGPKNRAPHVAIDRHAAHSATEPEGFITKEALAIRLSRTVRTVENWQRRGIIPYVKCGRCVLFKWTDVETHLQTHFRVCGQNRSRPPIAASRSAFGVPPLGGSVRSDAEQRTTDNGLSRRSSAEAELLITDSPQSSTHPNIQSSL